MSFKDGKMRAIDDWNCMLIFIKEKRLETSLDADIKVYLPSSQLTVDLANRTCINVRGSKKSIVNSTSTDRYTRFRP